MLVLTLALALGFQVVRIEDAGCGCDPARAEAMQARQCSLCREAEKQAPDAAVFFLKDINPRKPNRMLALPRAHIDGNAALERMSAEERARFWQAAIEKARALWDDEWGLALNGDKVRTQCHPHVHIGRLIKGVETENFVVVADASRIPVPKDGTGLWIHPQDGKLHVHLGEQICEAVLFR